MALKYHFLRYDCVIIQRYFLAVLFTIKTLRETERYKDCDYYILRIIGPEEFEKFQHFSTFEKKV